MSEDVIYNLQSPYPEFESVIKKLHSMTDIWDKVIIDEKDFQDRTRDIESLFGEAKEEAIYELESRPAGGIHFACLEAIRSLGVDNDVYAVARLTIAIRHVACQQLSA